MKQLVQSFRDGASAVVTIPVPKCTAGKILIQTSVSLVSAGTERMLVEFGKGNLVQKARLQPDKVKQVLEKARSDGFAATYEAVRSKLDQPVPLGYCNVGTIVESRADGFRPGDRVVSNGGHAQFVSVPKNLCARIPDSVSDESASFTVIGAIGLQGVRLAQPTLGECVVVSGLGLIGLLTVQILRAHGCRVLGIDIDPTRLALARSFGADAVAASADDDLVAQAVSFSRGRGVDAVIITASAQGDELISQAARMCRKRGRIVLVGVVGLQLNRADFYEKELSFQVSCSYGPGRYDPNYEEGGHDYPVGFVRWTEQRNFEAVLDLLASGAIDVTPLISHRFQIEEGADAMELLASDQPSLGIVLNYPKTDDVPSRLVPLKAPVGNRLVSEAAVVGFLGAGNYASRVLMPAFKAAGAELRTVVSSGGVSAVHFGRKFGFVKAATDEAAVLNDSNTDTVVIATRHGAHGAQVLAALRAGKHVFCEKPLCLTLAELNEIEAEGQLRPSQHLVVGFNRRFAPHVRKMKELLAPIEQPKAVIITVNAGEIPADHWTQDSEVGGGRIIGEACHFVDLARHIVDFPITGHTALALGRHASTPVREDKACFHLRFADGSIASIQYLANGNKGFPKERVEVFAAGRVLQLDNFRTLRGWGWRRFSRTTSFRQDKGVGSLVGEFVSAIRNGGPQPIPFAEILETSAITIQLAQDLRA